MAYNNLIAYTFTDNKGQAITDSSSVTTIETMISSALSLLTLIAVIYFAFQIIFAGYSFLNSKGDPKLVQIAKDKIVNSILGLVIVIIAFGATALISNILGLGNIFDLNAVINRINP